MKKENHKWERKWKEERGEWDKQTNRPRVRPNEKGSGEKKIDWMKEKPIQNEKDWNWLNWRENNSECEI